MNVGQTYILQYKVLAKDSASALSIDNGDDFPKVLATSRMVAFMELAAARLMRPLLSLGELSVGVNVNVDHVAATPIGAKIKVIAQYTGRRGKLYLFDVVMYDDGGLAGNGTHSRAIIHKDRLIDGAIKRVETIDSNS